MKYKLIERANPQNRQAAKKLYATPVNEGTTTKSDLSKEIVKASSLARGDVSNAIETMIDVIPKHLLKGKSVSLGEFGTFRISFSSEGVNSAEEFETSMISDLKIIFTPSVALKEQFRNVIFEKSE